MIIVSLHNPVSWVSIKKILIVRCKINNFGIVISLLQIPDNTGFDYRIIQLCYQAISLLWSKEFNKEGAYLLYWTSLTIILFHLFYQYIPKDQTDRLTDSQRIYAVECAIAVFEVSGSIFRLDQLFEWPANIHTGVWVFLCLYLQ